jgi:hypothetical protein
VLQPRCTIAAVPSLPSTHASAARLAIEATCTEGGGGGGGGGRKENLALYHVGNPNPGLGFGVVLIDLS